MITDKECWGGTPYGYTTRHDSVIECWICGAGVVNPERHVAWHNEEAAK